MKIEVSLGVSSNSNFVNISLEDLNLTKEEWDELSQEAKDEAIQNYVFDMNDQPYWMVDKYEER